MVIDKKLAFRVAFALETVAIGGLAFTYLADSDFGGHFREAIWVNLSILFWAVLVGLDPERQDRRGLLYGEYMLNRPTPVQRRRAAHPRLD